MKAKLHPVVFGVVLALLGACTEKSHSTKARPEGDTHAHEEGEHAEQTDGHVEAHPAHPRRRCQRATRCRDRGVEAALQPALGSGARVEFSQQGHARVSSRVTGRVVDLRVVAGTQVKKGEVLAFVDSPQLGEARARYLAAAARAGLAQGNFRREKALFEKGISPERDVREAEAALVSANAEMNSAEAALHALGLEDAQIRRLKADEHYGSRFPVVSPIAGTVVDVSATVGQSVEPAAALFTVGNLSVLWVILQVSESQLVQVEAGMTVEIGVGSRGGRSYAGKVDYVGDVVDPKTRTIPVRVVVPNPERQAQARHVRDGAVAAATSDAGTRGDSVVVPREAVQSMGDEQIVFVPAGPNQFKPVEVRTGTSTASEDRDPLRARGRRARS